MKVSQLWRMLSLFLSGVIIGFILGVFITLSTIEKRLNEGNTVNIGKIKIKKSEQIDLPIKIDQEQEKEKRKRKRK